MISKFFHSPSILNECSTRAVVKKKERITEFAHRPSTQRVTSRPVSRHFSGLGSFLLHLRNATFSEWHLVPMCFDDAISTDDVGIGCPDESKWPAISTMHHKSVKHMQISIIHQEDYTYTICEQVEKWTEMTLLIGELQQLAETESNNWSENEQKFAVLRSNRTRLGALTFQWQLDFLEREAAEEDLCCVRAL